MACEPEIAKANRFPRVFLLSPALAGGRRGSLLLREKAEFDTALRLRDGRATVAEIHSFISGLYFRGKVAYTEAFSDPPDGAPPALVILPGAGLVDLDHRLSREELARQAEIAVDPGNAIFREPLLRAAVSLEHAAGASCRFVLLGSIASAKYTDPLLEVFGERLLFPQEFVGRGDMSRGGLMLRCAEARRELSYIPVLGAERWGKRPPRLEPRSD